MTREVASLMGQGTEGWTAEKMVRKEVASRRSLMLPTCWGGGGGGGGVAMGPQLGDEDSE